MKIATITFQNADNYGAMLQCYALQQAITRIGYKCDVIDYYCEYLSKPYSVAALKRKGFIRFILGNINVLVRLPRKGNFKKFREEISKTISVDKSNIKILNNEYDVFITGSDQVWNYQLTNFDTSYFLDFVNDSDKKISYAASLGFDDFSDKVASQYYNLLKDYKCISVREVSAKKLLDNILCRDIQVVLDPTLLLAKEDWDKILVEPQKSKYIFVYQLSPSSYFTYILKELKRKTGLKVIAVPFVMGCVCAEIDMLAGPSEWLGYIKNAEYIVTDSFHATVFALVYNKKLYSCVNESASRIVDLLSMVKMKCFLFRKGREFSLINDVDYINSNKILDMQREQSLCLLERMISK